jgi:hypothetical protein
MAGGVSNAVSSPETKGVEQPTGALLLRHVICESDSALRRASSSFDATERNNYSTGPIAPYAVGMASPARPEQRNSARHSFATQLDDGGLQLLVKDDDYLLATWRRIVIVVWKGNTTFESVTRVGEAINSLARKEGPAGLFIVTDVTAPLPPALVRKTAANILATAPIGYFCVTFEGNGFRAAAVRGVVTSITMFTTHAFPHRAFSNIEEAAVWVSEQTRFNGLLRIQSSALEAVLVQLRKSPNTAR